MSSTCRPCGLLNSIVTLVSSTESTVTLTTLNRFDTLYLNTVQLVLSNVTQIRSFSLKDKTSKFNMSSLDLTEYSISNGLTYPAVLGVILNFVNGLISLLNGTGEIVKSACFTLRY